MKISPWMVAVLLPLVVSCVAWAATDDALPELTALEAVKLALQNDSGLRQAELNLTLARLDLQATQYSTFLPSVGFSVGLPQWTADGLGTEVEGALTVTVPLPWGSGALETSLGLLYDLETSAFVSPSWRAALSDLFDLAQPSSRLTALATRQRAVESAQISYLETESALVVSSLTTYSDLLSEARQADVDQESVSRQQDAFDQLQALAAQGYKGGQDLNEAQLLLLDAQIQAEASAETYASHLDAFCRQTLGLTETRRLASLDLSMDALLVAASDLLKTEVPEAAVSETLSVISAQQSVQDATDALREARSDALPSLSIEASIDSTEWSVGLGLSFDLFAPDRWTQVEMAETKLTLAEEQLTSAKRSTRNQILDQQAALLTATRSGERLALETEKWRLEDEVMAAKHAAGSISDTEWAEFLIERGTFTVDAAGRAASVLVSYLTYRNVLGLELNWEEWL